ncbi:hypothetical protein AK88_00242 [Plasmodium fragile]|uniref:Uncharacterized protein n=1 Tax=Plasmodium fragile TaxID=5857 RepID=A0A0D9QSZ3_PLAFR|nr:uncharacterized protein AK88_00242 [Plasmodium fragile]KJP90073.1 hypothetical protein AK88_00242 [Plasmodium fragile]
MASPNRTVPHNGIAGHNRMATHSGMASPNITVPHNGIAAHNRMATHSGMLYPNRSATHNGMVSPNRVAMHNGMVSPNRVAMHNGMVSPNRVAMHNGMVSPHRIAARNAMIVPNGIGAHNDFAIYDDIAIYNNIAEVDRVVGQGEYTNENPSPKESVTDNGTAIVGLNASQRNMEDSPAQGNTHSESTPANAMNAVVAENENHRDSADNSDDILNGIRARYNDFLHICFLKNENMPAVRDEDEAYLDVYNGNYLSDTDYSCDESVGDFGKMWEKGLTEEEKFILRRMEEVLEDVKEDDVISQPDYRMTNGQNGLNAPNGLNGANGLNRRCNCKRNHRIAFQHDSRGALQNGAQIYPASALENARRSGFQNGLERVLNGENRNAHANEHFYNNENYYNEHNMANAQSYEQMERNMMKRQKIFLPRQ